MDLRVGAYGVIVDDGKILLAHWNGQGSHGSGAWTLPGGGIEPGESPEDAAVREILEETGYTAVLEGLLGVSSHVLPSSQRANSNSPLHAIRIVYRARITGGTLTNEIGGSTDEAAWFFFDALTQLKHSVLLTLGLQYAGIELP